MTTTTRAAIFILLAFLIVAVFVAWVTGLDRPCPTGQVQVLMPGGYTCRPERTGGEVP
jgi:hypothetical protein